MAKDLQRTHARELPSTQEILDMMVREAQREPSGSEHFPDFSVVNQWLKKLRIKSNLFYTTSTLDEVNEASGKIKQTLVERTLEEKPLHALKKELKCI